VAVTASEIQTYLGERSCPIFRKLLDLTWVDRHEVCADITGEFFGITPGGFDNARHMTFDARQLHRGVCSILMLVGLFEVALLTPCAGGLLLRLAKLYDT